MARIIETTNCPKCGKGVLKGTIRKRSRVLLKCSFCKQTFQLKQRSVTPEEWRDESELPIVPPGVFLGFAKRLIEYCRVFGSENLAASADVHKITKLPIFSLFWMRHNLGEMSAKAQLEAKVEPIRVIMFVAKDPLWIEYGIAKGPYTKLASDDEIDLIQKIAGAEV